MCISLCYSQTCSSKVKELALLTCEKLGVNTLLKTKKKHLGVWLENVRVKLKSESNMYFNEKWDAEVVQLGKNMENKQNSCHDFQWEQ